MHNLKYFYICKNILNKTNSQTIIKKSIVSYIKKRRKQ